MSFLNYRKFLNESLNEGMQGDITLPALKANVTVGKNFSYQEAIDSSSGTNKAALENEAIFLSGVLTNQGKGIDYGTLGEYLVANCFGGEQTNPAGGSATENTIFYDVKIKDTFLSVKTSLSSNVNAPASVLGSSRLKRNNILSIFTSNEGNLFPIDTSNISKYAMQLLEYVENPKSFPKQSAKFGFGLVFEKDKKFRVVLTSTVTKMDLLDVISKQWNNYKGKVKTKITEENVIELFLNVVMPADKVGRLSGDWSPSNIIKFFGGVVNNVELSVDIASSADREKIIKFLASLDTDALKNFAVSQGYIEK
jgi:hypothetical protein